MHQTRTEYNFAGSGREAAGSEHSRKKSWNAGEKSFGLLNSGQRSDSCCELAKGGSASANSQMVAPSDHTSTFNALYGGLNHDGQHFHSTNKIDNLLSNFWGLQRREQISEFPPMVWAAETYLPVSDTHDVRPHWRWRRNLYSRREVGYCSLFRPLPCLSNTNRLTQLQDTMEV